MALQPMVIRSQPGIKRDGTLFQGEYYVDGQWVRFQRQLPRKIGGYTTTNRFLVEICRGMKTYTVGNYTYIFTGSASYLQYHTVDLEGNSSILIDRTPTTLTDSQFNIWQFEIIVDTTLVPPVNQIVAHVSPNAQSLSNTAGGQIFIGNLISDTVLEEFTEGVTAQYVQPTGGIVALHPYLVVYGNDGTLAWSAPGRPKVFYPFEFEITTVTTGAQIFAGEHGFFLNASSTAIDNTAIIVGELTDSPYDTLASVTGTYTFLTFAVANPAAYLSATNTVFLSTNTNFTIQSSISTGGTNFVVTGDITAVFTVGATFTVASQSDRIYVVSSANYNGSSTTVVITGVFAQGYTAGSALYKFVATPVIINDIIAVGKRIISALGNFTSTFPAGTNYITFNNSSVRSHAVSTVTSNAATFIRFVAPQAFTKGFPQGTAVYKEGTSADTGAGNARIASQKIVKGLPLRGGPGNSPSGIFWSTDAVLRMSFVGGDLIFQFDTISAQSSILSAASVIEHDGIYYWVGTDRFLVFNGVVRELPNDLNINWFFDNINRSQSQRVYSFKIPRYSEIWWCFPFGNAVECTHAVIYNIRENTWYDTKLPNQGRSAAEFIALFGAPIMTGVDPILVDEASSTIAYRLWSHERGTDEIDGQNVFPVDSYFTTADFSLISQPQGKLKNLRVAVMEPDFIQSGDMTVEIIGRANPRSKDTTGDPKVYPAISFTPSDQVIYFKEERRILRFKFRSNSIGGDYQMGQVVAHIEEADGTYLGGSA